MGHLGDKESRVKGTAKGGHSMGVPAPVGKGTGLRTRWEPAGILTRGVQASSFSWSPPVTLFLQETRQLAQPLPQAAHLLLFVPLQDAQRPDRLRRPQML